MEEIKKINVEHEIMGLQYYIEAMQKHEHRKATLEDLGNLMIHVNNLKAWAGITNTEQQSNCNLPHVSNNEVAVEPEKHKCINCGKEYEDIDDAIMCCYVSETDC